MDLLNWFSGLFSANGTLNLDVSVDSLAAEVFYKELAVQSCVNLIGNAVARGEFLTYENGQQVTKDMYYLLNVEPNQNKSASKFWRDVVHKLVYENECLVVQVDKKFYVADSFSPKKFALKENVYTNVVIEDYGLKGSFLESQVLHFELHDKRIKDIIEGLYASYSQLITASTNSFKKNKYKRVILNVPSSYPQTEKAQEALTDLLAKKFKKFFSAVGDAVLPLTNDLTIAEDKSSQDTTYGSDTSKEIKQLIEDIFSFIAIAFHIPPQLLLGNVADTDKAVNNFLTFCINPLAELIADEINRKLYGKELFLQKTYMKIDTSRIKAVDIKDVANALDVLVRMGGFCIDDCLLMLGKEPLNTDWSRIRWMTKNYQPVTEAVKGGEIKNAKNRK